LSGTLTSQGGTGFGDTIMTPGGGGLTNNGTIQYSGALHTLALAGAGAAYTQGTQGTLIFRLGNGQTSDLFTISGAATLAGTVNFVAQGNLNARQVWTVITAGGGFGGTDFTQKIYPNDGNPRWAAGPPVGGFYTVQN
jgi:hypothetical protein